MSKKKKGMFSWLGFGQDEKEQVVEETSESAELDTDEQTVEHSNEAEPLAVIDEQPNEPIIDADINELEAEVDQLLPAATGEKTEPEPVAFDIVEPEQEGERVDDISDTAESQEIDQAPAELKPQEEEPDAHQANEPQATPDKEAGKQTKLGFFARLKQGLSKTRQNLGGGLFDLFRGKQIDDDLFEELETHLLMADVGVETTMKIIDSLTKSASRKQLKDAEALYELLKIELKKVIETVSQPLEIPQSDGPFVMLMVGGNGVGKTTTIGKLAKQFQAQGKSVMLAAGDTFRAAAVEQLQVWGERNDIPVIAQHTGADSASVIFDAISAAKARNVDIIIGDTAGRLQNKAHLMEELKKVVRVMKKLDVDAPHEVMLTLDAGTGQNALSQTKLFDEAVGLTGLTVTKLDGTAKGGVVFAIADKYNIPIRYLGVGEGINDLRPFDGNDFIDALFAKE